MNWFEAVILGIIEGITEFLPISSTGHLVLFSSFLGIHNSDFLKTFEIAIQLGAILSVVVLYWQKIFFDRKVMLKVLSAFIPTALIGLFLYKLFKETLLIRNYFVLWSLFLGGIFLILFELLRKGKSDGIKLENISYRKAFIVGIFQAFSIVPGVSRAGATILGGLALGIERKAIVEFSFLLAFPTMAAATIFDLSQTAGSFSPGDFYVLLIGFAVSFLVAMGAIKFLLKFIKTHTFIPFGIFRIVISLIFPLSFMVT